jgi:site-specific recombinase XerD
MKLVDSFLNQLTSAQTRRAYRRDLRDFFGEDIPSHEEVEEIEVDDLRMFVRRLRDDGLSEATQRRRLAALRGFFDWLIEQGHRSDNPARHPRVTPLAPAKGPSETADLTKESVESLIEAAGEPSQSGSRDQALILTILYGALRRDEVAHLEVDDIRPLGRYWVIDLPASANGSYVRIPDVVVDAIERMKARHGITSGPLWRSLSNRNRGEPMTPDAIYKAVRRVAKRAGQEPMSIDTLRRAGLQLALDGGADLTQVKAHGRYQSVDSAARLYDTNNRSGALGDSAVDHIDLDLPTTPREPSDD